MNKTYYNIIPLKVCFTGSTQLQDAIDRITKGPLDLCGGEGLHPIYMISSPENYYLLEVEEYIDNRLKETIVGFVEISSYKPKKEEEYLIYVIELFEIFHEYRGKGYGKEFAKKIIYSKKYLSSEEADKSIGVEIAQITASTFMFWWNAIKKEMMCDLVSTIFPFEEGEKVEGKDKKRLRIEKYIKHLRHDETVTRIFTDAVSFIIDTDECSTTDVITYIEALDDFKKCVKHVDTVRCSVCNVFYPTLVLTGCGIFYHNDDCKYKLMCKRCYKKIADVGGRCPGDCMDGKLCKLIDKYVYSIE